MGERKLKTQTLKMSKFHTSCSSSCHDILSLIDADFQMASSDSDSSLGDQTEYTETSVLLGYASKEVTEDAISHLGGVPVCTAPSCNYLTNLC